MISILLNKNNKIIFFSLLLSLVLAFATPLLPVAILLIMIVITLSVFGDKLLIPFFLISFLVITSDISETLRVAVNISSFILLSFYFIKEFGLDFKVYKPVPSIITNLILYIIFTLFLSSFFSAKISVGIIEVVRLIVFLYLIYIFYSFINNVNDVKILLGSLLIAGVLLALTILYFFWSSHSDLRTLEVQGLVHEGGYYNNVAAAGGIFAITISLNLALLFSKKKNLTQKRILLITTLLIQIVALLLTNSRAAFLAVAVSFIFISYNLNKGLFKKISLWFVGLSALIIGLFPQIIKIIDIFIRAGRILENTRYFLWNIAYSIIDHNPLLGVGPGMFKYYMYKYLPVRLGSWTETQISWVHDEAGAGHAHNFILYRTSETGFIGLIGALALIIIFVMLSVKIIGKVKQNQDVFIMMIAILGSGYGLFARSLFESTGILTNGWITRDLPFWILFIIVIFLYQKLFVEKVKLEDL